MKKKKSSNVHILKICTDTLLLPTKYKLPYIRKAGMSDFTTASTVKFSSQWIIAPTILQFRRRPDRLCCRHQDPG